MPAVWPKMQCQEFSALGREVNGHSLQYSAVYTSRCILESTGGPTKADNAAPSLARASARAALSRTCWPTTDRRRHGTARRTRSSTPPPTAPAGCFSRRPRRRVWPGPFDPGPPDPKFEFGRWLVTAPGPGPGGQRTFA